MQTSQRNQNTQGRMQISQRNQDTQGRRIVQEERQEIQKTYQTRTQNTYVVRENQRVVSPGRIEPTRTTNYNLNRDLNRQAAANTSVNAAVKNQVSNQVNNSRGYGYDSNINQSQDRSSREGRIYHYEQASRRDYQGNNNANREHRGRVVSSVEPGQQQRTQYTQMRNNNYQVNQNRVYVSGSPGYRRTSHNVEEDEYHSNIRGGIVRFKRWKYTTQTEINKIILIQR